MRLQAKIHQRYYFYRFPSNLFRARALSSSLTWSIPSSSPSVTTDCGGPSFTASPNATTTAIMKRTQSHSTSMLSLTGCTMLPDRFRSPPTAVERFQADPSRDSVFLTGSDSSASAFRAPHSAHIACGEARTLRLRRDGGGGSEKMPPPTLRRDRLVRTWVPAL